MFRVVFINAALSALATAHTAAWANGMYCRGGNETSKDDANTNLAVNPLFNLTKEDWWFQHDRGCDTMAPPLGEFLEVPANGNFTVELAHNRAFTTLSYNGTKATAWPDGGQFPGNRDAWHGEGSGCLSDGALHTYNESDAAGTAWAISYESDIAKVTLENLVVFSVLEHTPWKRLASYLVPDLPACPEGGCTCAWLWVPNGCGQGNMYMQPYKCTVTNATSTTALAKAQAPTYCASEPSKCVHGAKQMLAWRQATGNNIETEAGISPGYNEKCGWKAGAQTDISQAETSLSSTAAPALPTTLATKVATISTSALSASATCSSAAGSV